MKYLKLNNLTNELESGLRRFCDRNEYEFTVADVLGRNGELSHFKALVALKEADDEEVEVAIIVTTTIDNAYRYVDIDRDDYEAIARQMMPEVLCPTGAVFYW